MVGDAATTLVALLPVLRRQDDRWFVGPRERREWLPPCALLGASHDGVAVYGSDAFTGLTEDELPEQLVGWVARENIPKVKMRSARHGVPKPPEVLR